MTGSADVCARAAPARADAGGRSGRDAVGGAAQRRDVDLAHLQHRLHGAAAALVAGRAQQLVHALGPDLPGQAEAVLEPPARALLPAVAELLPVVVDLGLVGALDLEGHRLAEGELGAAVDADKALAVQLPFDGHDGARLARPGLVVVVGRDDAGVREDRDVELGRLLGLGVVPQARDDARHGAAPLGAVVLRVGRRARGELIGRRRAPWRPRGSRAPGEQGPMYV